MQSIVLLWLESEDEPASARRLVPELVSFDDVEPVAPLSPPPRMDEHPLSIAMATTAAVAIPNCFFMMAPLHLG